MLENLVLFAILVFAARLANVSNAMTLLGAQLFFFGRVAHAILYIVGIPWLRTAAWLVSVIGLAPDLLAGRGLADAKPRRSVAGACRSSVIVECVTR